MKANEYRDLISSVSDVRTSLLSAATSDEQRKEAIRLRKVVSELRAACCPQAGIKDREKAARVLAICDSLLVEKQQDFDRADMALINMAYGRN